MSKLLVAGILACFLISCSKNDESTNNNIEVESDYTPMEIGNYWIYQHYHIDSVGNETVMPITDSVIITGESFIDGEKYFILEGTNYPFN